MLKDTKEYFSKATAINANDNKLKTLPSRYYLRPWITSDYKPDRYQKNNLYLFLNGTV